LKGCKILSIEAKDLFGAMNLVSRGEGGYEIRKKTGEFNLKKFTAAMDESLDSIHLREVYEKRVRRKDFSFRVGKHHYTKHVICVTWNYSYKEFNLAGKNTYIRDGYTYADCEFKDCVCVLNGKLIAIQTSVAVSEPLSQEVLGEYFGFDGTCYRLMKQPKTVMGRSELRRYLYENGFVCDDTRYVRYKRSAGSSRVGKCLFVNEVLAKDMEKWDMCGLDIKPGQELDLAAYEAYISLPMSSIIDTIRIEPENILVISDYESLFDDDVVAVEEEDGHLVAAEKTVQIKNSIWDGQSLLDRSMFGKYEDKGMILLRNRFFKSCCFNTNIQDFFLSNGIDSIDQLNGFTLAADVSQIKMITTPSSIKYAKFGEIADWLRIVSPVYGLVKYEKPTHYFGGRLVQTHYQLFNTLHISYAEMNEILKPSFDYISAVRNDPAVLRYEINYPIDVPEEEERPLLTKNEIVFKMLGINDEFAQTAMYNAFRNDLVKGMLRNLKRGHVLVSGNYSTMMGNGLEMLYGAIGRFKGKTMLGVGNIHSMRFAYGAELLCSRSPHICASNIMLATNVANKEIDRYFNLTPEIVCVNAIGENIQQKLNGCDYDSDTILITDNAKLIEIAKRHYGEFKVPTNLVGSAKIKRVYTSDNRADLDAKTSVNNIGSIVNCSQILNSIMWHRINHGATIEECKDIFLDICKLAVLSNCEIDSAKREYAINSTTELNILKKKNRIDDGGRSVKPRFFKMICVENGYKIPDNVKYRDFDTSMDYLHKAVASFKIRESRASKSKKLPFMSVVSPPDMNYRQGYYYSKRDEIAKTIREARDAINCLYTGYDEKLPGEKESVKNAAAEIRESCVEAIRSLNDSKGTMYMCLKELDDASYRDVSRFAFEVLFSDPESKLFELIRESAGEKHLLCEDDEGDISFYGIRFSKIPF